MKFASYNVENLFDRAKVFNEDVAVSTPILKAESRVNQIFEKEVYTAADKKEILKHLETLGLLRSDEGEYAWLRRNRGALLHRPRTKKGEKPKPVTVVANGRGDWIGWVELKTAPVREEAVLNTGRVIRDVNADVLAVVEAENRTALHQFSAALLEEVNGRPYDQIMLIDGNDDRGIDVGLMTKLGYDIGLMRSHVQDLRENGEPVFSRDCPEYEVTTPKGETIWFLPNHFSSKFGGDNPDKKKRRADQAAKVAEIYRRLRKEKQNKVVVLGDLNDTPDSEPLQELLANTDLKDVSLHPKFDTGPFKGKGTFGNGSDKNKIDYLLLSPALYKRITACGLFRMGAWPGKQNPKWPVYPELKDEKDVASDHHVIWVEIRDP